MVIAYLPSNLDCSGEVLAIKGRGEGSNWRGVVKRDRNRIIFGVSQFIAGVEPEGVTLLG